MLKTPKFWYRKNFLSRVIQVSLLPISLVYACFVVLVRALSRKIRHEVPVISVGGFTAGGSGKTPVTIALVKLLKENGKNPHIITRGYGKQSDANEAVVSSNPFRYGDEAVLLSGSAPTWSGSDKELLISMAVKDGADVIVLDDGLQSFSVHKDLSLAVVDKLQGLGNGFVIPAGPIREPLWAARKDTDCVVLISSGLTNDDNYGGVRLLHCSLIESISDCNQDIIAFCGIGYPKKFEDTLIRLGKNVKEFIVYPDHHVYQDRDLDYLAGLSESLSLPLVTTEKDMCKLPESFRSKVIVVKIAVELDSSILNLLNIVYSK